MRLFWNIRSIVLDAIAFARNLCLSRSALAAENLFLRKQLTFFVERKQAPLRTDNIHTAHDGDSREAIRYYHSCRTHLSLEKDAPEPRRVESPAMGKVRAIPKVGGLHHYYTRHAAA